MYRIDGKIYNYDFYSEEYMDEGKLKVGRQSEQTSDYNDDYEKFYNRFNLFVCGRMPQLAFFLLPFADTFTTIERLI